MPCASVGLRGSPLIEYKSEGYELFLDMMINIRRNVVYSLFQPQIQPICKRRQSWFKEISHLSIHLRYSRHSLLRTW